MNIAICDDERFFLQLLKSKLSQYFDPLGIPISIDTFNSAVLLLDSMEVNKYDVIFLDVSMPQVNGIEAGRVIVKKAPDTALVYISGLLEFAPISHEIESTVRYILKSQIDEKINECMAAVLQKLNFKQKKVTIDFTQGEMSVFRHSIITVTSLGHLLTVNFASNKKDPLETRKYSLKTMLQLLGEDLFVQIEQSCIVNMAYIDAIENSQHGYQCVMNDGTKLYISQRKLSNVKRQFFLYRGKI